MAEDRGAFKTNPAKPRPIPAIVITRERRCSEALGPQKPFKAPVAAGHAADFLTNGGSRCGILG
jgi:hypothetical protein